MGDGDRMDRAGRYVLGLMDEDERERAERDLEIDPAFRDAMMVIAGRMHIFDRAPDQPTGQPTGNAPPDGWRQIKERIDAMPQMRTAPEAELKPPEPPGPPVTFGRRRSDRKRDVPETPAKTIGTGLHSIPGQRGLLLALCLTAAFALGYMVGVASVWPAL